MWKTKITELLGINYPIIQGAMAYLSESNLVAAVCHAGGTGVIATGGADIDTVREQIRRTKDMTDKPFGVNLMLQSPNKDDVAQLVCDENWRLSRSAQEIRFLILNHCSRTASNVFPSCPMRSSPRACRTKAQTPLSSRAWKPAAMTAN